MASRPAERSEGGRVRSFAAVDLGASSGRVMLAELGGGQIALREVHRFPNRPVTVQGMLHWDVLALWAGVLDGLREAARSGPLHGIGIDSWAIDYGLLDADGRLLANPVHYRDARTDGVAANVHASVTPADMYARTGVQALPFNTIFQFAAARETWAMRNAAHAVLMPDLIGYWLTGELRCELTNASTTGLLDARSRDWATTLFDALDLRADLFPPVTEPGTPVGALRPDVAADAGLDGVLVTTVGSHDTASAVVGVPARTENFAYISCGTGRSSASNSTRR